MSRTVMLILGISICVADLVLIFGIMVSGLKEGDAIVSNLVLPVLILTGGIVLIVKGIRNR